MQVQAWEDQRAYERGREDAGLCDARVVLVTVFREVKQFSILSKTSKTRRRTLSVIRNPV